MAKDSNYTSKDIQELDDREYVRLRTQIYFGNMHSTSFVLPNLLSPNLETFTAEFVPAAYKAVGEIIDNAVDEFSQITTRKKELVIDANPSQGTYSVSDTGRGIPIDKRPNGKYTPQVALGSLKASRNFNDDDKEIGVIGQNGVGAACTNFCSTSFTVDIVRDKQHYHQVFTNGSKTISKPVITPSTAKYTGTKVSFTLDPAVFKNIAIPDLVMQNRAIYLAMTNPDITVIYNGETYRFKNGLMDILPSKLGKGNFATFTIAEPDVTGEFYVAWGKHAETDLQMFTWVNSSLLLDGGKCNTQFANALTDKISTHLEKQAKRLKIEISKADIRQGITVYASLKVKNPEYDSQAKTRLTAPDMRKVLDAMLDSQWDTFTKQATNWLTEIVERAAARYHRAKDNEAQRLHEKKREPILNLLDATSKNRLSCSLLITEGESAKSQVCEARNPEIIGAYSLTGKVNNVYGMTPAQVLNTKIAELFRAIGLTPGKPAVRSELNYGRAIISTDADVDGGDIFCLLVNAFYSFWPELFDPKNPFIYRLSAPNICLTKNKDRVHIPTRNEYESVKHKYKGYDVAYYKGLGSMDMQDWRMLLNNNIETAVPIIDDGKLQETLTLLFGPSTDNRKLWLS